MRRPALFWVQLAVTALAALFLTAPIFLTALAAVTKNAFRGPSSGLTTGWIARVLSVYGDTVVRSLLLALAALAVTMAAGTPLAYALVKYGRRRWAMAIEEAVALPLSVPGLAIGLGILLCWGTVNWFRHSHLFILAGHAVYCLPFMTAAVASVLRVDPTGPREEAAMTLGAGFWTRFRTIILPAAAPGLVSGSLQVLTLSVGEFNISWMLQTPMTRTLPVGLADSYASMRLEIGAAYTVVFLVLIIPMLLLARRAPAIAARLAGSRRTGPAPPAASPDRGGAGRRPAGTGGPPPADPLFCGPLPGDHSAGGPRSDRPRPDPPGSAPDRRRARHDPARHRPRPPAREGDPR